MKNQVKIHCCSCWNLALCSDKIKLIIFCYSEFGSPSKELLSTLHTGLFAALVGGCVGGLKESQLKYESFVTKLNSEMFVSHSEAKVSVNYLLKIIIVNNNNTRMFLYLSSLNSSWFCGWKVSNLREKKYRVTFLEQ